jgi:acetyltransferase
VGISYQVSCGNDADLDVLDFASFMVESEATRVVMMLVERLPAGERLQRLADRALGLDKPIVMVKVGRTEAGSKAAASHTGSVTGVDAVCDAALRQMGIVRVDDCSELYETAMLLRQRKWPAGRRVAATSISGGNLVMAADIGAGLGLEWPELAAETQRRIAAILPGFGQASNPADLTAAAIGKPGAYARTSQAILDDPKVDALVPVLTIASEDDIGAVAAISQASPKPVAILWTGRAAGQSALTQETLIAQGHAVYRDATPCLKALTRTMWYAEHRRTRDAAALTRPGGIDSAAAAAALSSAPVFVSERLSKQVLAYYGIAVTREALARSPGEAADLAASFGAPVALKIESPDIPHKTEAGAIRLDVIGADGARAAYAAVSDAALRFLPSARIDGVLVQEMVRPGAEMLVGISRDPTFGPVLTIGMGGVLVEVFRDLAFLIPPVTPRQAREAIASLRSARLLQGVRGAPPADVEALVDAIVRLSWVAVDLGGTIEEMDVNPLVVLPQGQGVKVVDALIVKQRAERTAVGGPA